jgi:hypothetical protein
VYGVRLVRPVTTWLVAPGATSETDETCPVPTSVTSISKLGEPVPDIGSEAPLTGAEGLAIMHDLFGHLFPHLGTES